MVGMSGEPTVNLSCELKGLNGDLVGSRRAYWVKARYEVQRYATPFQFFISVFQPKVMGISNR